MPQSNPPMHAYDILNPVTPYSGYPRSEVPQTRCPVGDTNSTPPPEYCRVKVIAACSSSRKISQSINMCQKKWCILLRFLVLASRQRSAFPVGGNRFLHLLCRRGQLRLTRFSIREPFALIVMKQECLTAPTAMKT